MKEQDIFTEFQKIIDADRKFTYNIEFETSLSEIEYADNPFTFDQAIGLYKEWRKEVRRYKNRPASATLVFNFDKPLWINIDFLSSKKEPIMAAVNKFTLKMFSIGGSIAFESKFFKRGDDAVKWHDYMTGGGVKINILNSLSLTRMTGDEEKHYEAVQFLDEIERPEDKLSMMDDGYGNMLLTNTGRWNIR